MRTQSHKPRAWKEENRLWTCRTERRFPFVSSRLRVKLIGCLRNQLLGTSSSFTKTNIALAGEFAIPVKDRDSLSSPSALENMTFTTLTFLLFLPIIFAVHWMLPTRRMQNLLLLSASYVFYGWWDWRFCGLMLASCLVDYTIGIQLMRTEVPRRRKLTAGISRWRRTWATRCLQVLQLLYRELPDVSRRNLAGKRASRHSTRFADWDQLLYLPNARLHDRCLPPSDRCQPQPGRLPGIRFLLSTAGRGTDRASRSDAAAIRQQANVRLRLGHRRLPANPVGIREETRHRRSARCCGRSVLRTARCLYRSRVDDGDGCFSPFRSTVTSLPIQTLRLELPSYSASA